MGLHKFASQICTGKHLRPVFGGKQVSVNAYPVQLEELESLVVSASTQVIPFPHPVCFLTPLHCFASDRSPGGKVPCSSLHVC